MLGYILNLDEFYRFFYSIGCGPMQKALSM